MQVYLLVLHILLGQNIYSIPEDTRSEPHIEMTLDGVLKGDSLALFKPVDIDIEGEEPLKQVNTVAVFAWSDPALFDIARNNGKVVRAHCLVTISTFWKYRHAACHPLDIKLLPDNSFKANR